MHRIDIINNNFDLMFFTCEKCIKYKGNAFLHCGEFKGISASLIYTESVNGNPKAPILILHPTKIVVRKGGTDG